MLALALNFSRSLNVLETPEIDNENLVANISKMAVAATRIHQTKILGGDSRFVPGCLRRTSHMIIETQLNRKSHILEFRSHWLTIAEWVSAILISEAVRRL